MRQVQYIIPIVRFDRLQWLTLRVFKVNSNSVKNALIVSCFAILQEERTLCQEPAVRWARGVGLFIREKETHSGLLL